MDTRDKRASAVNVSLPFRALLPGPGTQTAGDRYQTGFMYRGLVPGDGGSGGEEGTRSGQMFHMAKWMNR